MSELSLRSADVLARRLYEAGCRYAFGMPGGEVLTLVDALEKAGIRFVLAKHENAAGFMAEGVYHRDGAPGILVATLGPGAMNGVNVVANALQDRVPMIVLTGCVDEDEAQHYTHQVLDHQAVFSPITKGTFRLSAETADIIADRAICLSTDPRPGPVHVDVPIGVADTEVPFHRARNRGHRGIPVADDKDLSQARDWIMAAKRPIAIVGLDMLDTGHEVHAFVEASQIPFVTTYKAKGVVSEDHPLCLGSAGLSPLADAHLVPLVKAADVIVAIGYDPIEMRPGWRELWDPNVTKVIDIAPVANDHYMHRATLNITADPRQTLTKLIQVRSVNHTWTDGEPVRVKRSLAKAFPENETWGPGAIIAECRAVLPKETLASADSGAHRILLSQMWQCFEPRALVQSSGLCTMGCALPLALGTKLAEPDRPVICFCGDAGLLMVAGELASAADLGLPVIIVVFVDASLALIEKKQRERQMTNRGVDFPRADFAAIGQAFGGEGYTVTSRAELRAALEQALVASTFTVIGAVIEQGAYDGRI